MAAESPFKPTHIRAWRKFRKLSLAQLAADAGVDKGNLSKLERGIHPYKQDVLEPIAKALGTTAEILMIRGPEEPTPIWTIMDDASPMVRRQIEEAAAAILRASKAD